MASHYETSFLPRRRDGQYLENLAVKEASDELKYRAFRRWLKKIEKEIDEILRDIEDIEKDREYYIELQKDIAWAERRLQLYMEFKDTMLKIDEDLDFIETEFENWGDPDEEEEEYIRRLENQSDEGGGRHHRHQRDPLDVPGHRFYDDDLDPLDI